MSDDEIIKNARPAPEGWVLRAPARTFSVHAGPFYFREESGGPGVGFYSESHHANLAGIVHGGALMTLADVAMFDTAIREIGMMHAVTVSMNAEFLRPAPVGAFIEAVGEVIKAGKSLIFVRGKVSAAGKEVLAFSGTLKRP